MALAKKGKRKRGGKKGKGQIPLAVLHKRYKRLQRIIIDRGAGDLQKSIARDLESRK